LRILAENAQQFWPKVLIDSVFICALVLAECAQQFPPNLRAGSGYICAGSGCVHIP
jgi:hypothetical protein